MKTLFLIVVGWLVLLPATARKTYTMTVEARIHDANGPYAEGINWQVADHKTVQCYMGNGFYKLDIDDTDLGECVVLMALKTGYEVINTADLKVPLLKEGYSQTTLLLLCQRKDIVQCRHAYYLDKLRHYKDSSALRKSSPQPAQDQLFGGGKLAFLVKNFQQKESETERLHRQVLHECKKQADHFFHKMEFDSMAPCYKTLVSMDSFNLETITDYALFELCWGSQLSSITWMEKAMAVPARNANDSLSLFTLLLLKYRLLEKDDSVWMSHMQHRMQGCHITDTVRLAKFHVIYGILLLNNDEEAEAVGYLQKGLKMSIRFNLTMYSYLSALAMIICEPDAPELQYAIDQLCLMHISHFRQQNIEQENDLNTYIYYSLMFFHGIQKYKWNGALLPYAMHQLMDAIRENPREIYTTILREQLADYNSKVYNTRNDKILFIRTLIGEATTWKPSKTKDYSIYLSYLYNALSTELHAGEYIQNETLAALPVPEREKLEKEYAAERAMAECNSFQYILPIALKKAKYALYCSDLLEHLESCSVKDSLAGMVNNIWQKLPKKARSVADKKNFAFFGTGILQSGILPEKKAIPLMNALFATYKELHHASHLNEEEYVYYLVFMNHAEKKSEQTDYLLFNEIIDYKYASLQQRMDTFLFYEKYAEQYCDFGLTPYLDRMVNSGAYSLAERCLDSVLVQYLRRAGRDSSCYRITEMMLEQSASLLLPQLFDHDTALHSRWWAKYEVLKKEDPFYRKKVPNEYLCVLKQLNSKMEDTLIAVLYTVKDKDSMITVATTLIHFLQNQYLALEMGKPGNYHAWQINAYHARLADCYAMIAAGQLQQGHWQEAAAAIDSSLCHEPNNVKATIKKGHLYLYTGRCDEALILYRSVEKKQVAWKQVEPALRHAFPAQTDVPCLAYIKTDLEYLQSKWGIRCSAPSFNH